MGLIPDNVIDEVLTRADIESVVGRYVLLKRQGANLWGLCPFHSEKTPSFSVNPAKGIYKCFGCGKGGNAIKFISEIEKGDYFNWVMELKETGKIIAFGGRSEKISVKP